MPTEIQLKNRLAVADHMELFGWHHFDMSMWFYDSHRDGMLGEVAEFDFNDCGTTACLAGHAISVMRNNQVPMPTLIRCHQFELEEAAASWLGCSTDMFSVNSWPDSVLEYVGSVVAPVEVQRGYFSQYAEWATVIAWLRGEFPGVGNRCG